MITIDRLLTTKKIHHCGLFRESAAKVTDDSRLSYGEGDCFRKAASEKCRKYLRQPSNLSAVTVVHVFCICSSFLGPNITSYRFLDVELHQESPKTELFLLSSCEVVVYCWLAYNSFSFVRNFFNEWGDVSVACCGINGRVLMPVLFNRSYEVNFETNSWKFSNDAVKNRCWEGDLLILGD